MATTDVINRKRSRGDITSQKRKHSRKTRSTASLETFAGGMPVFSGRSVEEAAHHELITNSFAFSD